MKDKVGESPREFLKNCVARAVAADAQHRLGTNDPARIELAEV